MKSEFKCRIKAVSKENADKFISSASIQEIKNIAPSININENSDLLPISFDACVVNKFNKNDDGINSEIAVKIAKNFIFKPINIEHKTTNVAGVILNYAFTSLDSHKILTDEEALASKDPYYITLGGVVWRYVKPELSDYLEECSDPDSPEYEAVSASWELGFDSYSLALKEDSSRDFNNLEIITDKDEINKIENSLRALGGTGKYQNKRVYRLVDNGVLPLGIGLTENPAADVKGVFAEKQEENTSNAALDEKNKKQISLLQENNVITNIQEKRMSKKISNLSEITDELIKTCQASDISNFISDEIEKASKDYEEKINSEKNKASQLESELEKVKVANQTLETTLTNLKSELSSLKDELAKIKNEQAIAEEQRNFDVRMDFFSKTFDLTAETKSIIAKELSSVKTEDEFKSYVEKMKVLLPAKASKKTTSASNDKPEVNEEKELEEAIKNGDQVVAKVPNSSTPTESLYEQYKNAFAPSEVLIRTSNKKHKNQ